jgi:hypothetical protein
MAVSVGDMVLILIHSDGIRLALVPPNSACPSPFPRLLHLSCRNVCPFLHHPHNQPATEYSRRTRSQTYSKRRPCRIHWDVHQGILRQQHAPRRRPRNCPLVPRAWFCPHPAKGQLDPACGLHGILPRPIQSERLCAKRHCRFGCTRRCTFGESEYGSQCSAGMGTGEEAGAPDRSSHGFVKISRQGTGWSGSPEEGTVGEGRICRVRMMSWAVKDWSNLSKKMMGMTAFTAPVLTCLGMDTGGEE